MLVGSGKASGDQRFDTSSTRSRLFNVFLPSTTFAMASGRVGAGALAKEIADQPDLPQTI